MKSFSSLLDVKRSNSSSHLREVLPANRSSLSPYKAIQASKLNSSSDLIKYEKKLALPGRKSLQYHQGHEFIDLVGNSSLDEKPRKEELIAACSAKKRKVLSTEPDIMQSTKNGSDTASNSEGSQSNNSFPVSSLVKLEKPQLPDSRSRITAQGSAACKVDGTIQRRDTEIESEKCKGIHSNSLSSGNEETKGSVFLTQVFFSIFFLFLNEKQIYYTTRTSVASKCALILYENHLNED